MTYSTILQKRCKCGCSKYPTLGYEGYNMDCRPDLKEKKLSQQKERQKKANANIKATRQLRSLAYSEPEVMEGSKKVETKSQLLREADRLFSLFIRNRDADKNGNVACVCCGKIYHIDQVDKEGKKIVQPLHFIDRGVYSLRFDEDNSHAGCSFCNLDMHLNKNGFAYRHYLEFMNATYGEEAVAEMALAHRKINKITAEQLKNIIDHYSNHNIN